MGDRLQSGQISYRLRVEFPNDESMRISPGAIYQSLFIQGRGALKREIVTYLRTCAAPATGQGAEPAAGAGRSRYRVLQATCGGGGPRSSGALGARSDHRHGSDRKTPRVNCPQQERLHLRANRVRRLGGIGRLLGQLYESIACGALQTTTTHVEHVLGRPARDFREFARDAATHGAWDAR